MKKTLIVLALIFLIGFANAQIKTGNYTQNEIDAINTSSIGATFLRCQMEPMHAGFFGLPNDLNYFHGFSCLSISKIEGGYMVSRKISQPSFSVNSFISCIGVSPVNQCVNNYVSFLKIYVGLVINDIKALFETYQTSHANNVITTNFGDINYFRLL